jgi:geranylgeranyl diphosphate synthase type II
LGFERVFSQSNERLESFFANYFESLPISRQSGAQELLSSVKYSLLQKGSKRFRPSLVFLTAEALGAQSEDVLPFAAAVEMIHTYSLIHDDLPCMDNDDLRRGQPTNHRVYGESTALLAGDALLTEAFCVIAQRYSSKPEVGLHLTAMLAEAAGIGGMVGGQAVDLKMQKSTDGKINLAELKEMHALKTGALIRVAAEGAACISTTDADQISNCKKLGEFIGLAFQLADDVLDYNPDKVENGNYITVLGLEGAKKELAHVGDEAKKLAQALPRAQSLLQLIDYNQSRQF